MRPIGPHRVHAAYTFQSRIDCAPPLNERTHPRFHNCIRFPFLPVNQERDAVHDCYSQACRTVYYVIILSIAVPGPSSLSRAGTALTLVRRWTVPLRYTGLKSASVEAKLGQKSPSGSQKDAGGYLAVTLSGQLVSC